MAGCGTCRIRKKACPGPGPDGCCSMCLHLRIECLQLYNQPVSCEYRRREVMDQIARWYRTRGTRPSDESLCLTAILNWLHVNRPTDAGHLGASRSPPIPTLTFRRPPDSPSPSSSGGPSFGATEHVPLHSPARSSPSAGSPHHSPPAGVQNLDGRPDYDLLQVPLPPRNVASTVGSTSLHNTVHPQSIRQSDRQNLGGARRSNTEPRPSSPASRYRPRTPEASPNTRSAMRPPLSRPRPTNSMADFPHDVPVKTGAGAVPTDGYLDPDPYFPGWLGPNPYDFNIGLDVSCQGHQPYEVTTPQDVVPPYWPNIVDMPIIAFDDPSAVFQPADPTSPINPGWPGVDHSYQAGSYPVGPDPSRWCPSNLPSREPSYKPSLPQNTAHSATSPRVLSLLTWDLPSR